MYITFFFLIINNVVKSISYQLVDVSFALVYMACDIIVITGYYSFRVYITFSSYMDLQKLLMTVQEIRIRFSYSMHYYAKRFVCVNFNRRGLMNFSDLMNIDTTLIYNSKSL